MPVVIVKLIEGVSKEQKKRVIERMTAVLKEELGKNPETTHIIIEEYPADSWGVRGKTVEEIRNGS